MRIQEKILFCFYSSTFLFVLVDKSTSNFIEGDLDTPVFTPDIKPPTTSCNLRSPRRY